MCAISFLDNKFLVTVVTLQQLFHQRYVYFTCSHKYLAYSFLCLYSLTKNVGGITKTS